MDIAPLHERRREARVEAGYSRRQLQDGVALGLPHSRPLPSVGPRCHELRIPDRSRTWCLVYDVAADAVGILEVFSKKTTATPQRALMTCRTRLVAYRAASGASASTSPKRNSPSDSGRASRGSLRWRPVIPPSVWTCSCARSTGSAPVTRMSPGSFAPRPRAPPNDLRFCGGAGEATARFHRVYIRGGRARRVRSKRR
jgi:phage-related protein